MKQGSLISLFVFLLLQYSCFAQRNIAGTWVSINAERSASGSFGIRHFVFGKNDWEVKASVFEDSALLLPVFTFRATGTYSIGEASGPGNNIHPAVFDFEKKYITLQTSDAAVIQSFGLNGCQLTYQQEKDITESGCAYLVSRTACAREFDLVSISGDTLFLGARPGSGGMCEAGKRPTTLGKPLKRAVQ